MWQLPSCIRSLGRFVSRSSIAILAITVLVTGYSVASGPEALVVRVQNLAGVTPDTTAEMLGIGEAIFAMDGIQSDWQNMSEEAGVNSLIVSTGPTETPVTRNLYLRLTTSHHAFSTNPNCLGEALVAEGGGHLAIIYVDRIRTLAQQKRLPLGTVLGHAAAHEIAHLLIGTSKHTQYGLMRGRWTDFEFEAMRTGALRVGSPLARSISDNLRTPETLCASLAQPKGH